MQLVSVMQYLLCIIYTRNAGNNYILYFYFQMSIIYDSKYLGTQHSFECTDSFVFIYFLYELEQMYVELFVLHPILKDGQ
jgi:hypothetical protein